MEKKTLTDSIGLANYLIRIPVEAESSLRLHQGDTLASCLLYLDKSHSQNIWKSTIKSAEFTANRFQSVETNQSAALFALIELIYGFSIKQLTYSAKHQVNSHLLGLKNVSFNKDTIELEYDASNVQNLHDILLYSPRSIDNNNEKVLFIFYQLLKFYKYLHSINLNCHQLKLSDIYIDQNYWIKIQLPIESILEQYRSSFANSRLNDTNENEVSSFLKLPLNTSLLRQTLTDKYESYKHLTHEDLAGIVKNWCYNKLSNFDYLLIINCISGRQFESPFNYPIFPWISDFASLNTNLRDLTATKFRLNKGDAHLDLTYQASASSDTGPYHLTEFLSEITYFIYKARVTDKQTLCLNVRRNWVPNEYPNSIQRVSLQILIKTILFMLNKILILNNIY